MAYSAEEVGRSGAANTAFLGKGKWYGNSEIFKGFYLT